METSELVDAYAAGWSSGKNGALSSERHVDGLCAVAAKARELDAARGGTITVEQLNGWRARIRQYIGTAAVEEFDTHLFAQGRTIAEKDARIAELRAMLASTESALATLRQAVGSIIPAIRRGLGKDNGSSTFPLTAARGEWEAILDAMSITPTEHPDTAMLREVTAEHKTLLEAAAPYLTHDGESWVAHVDPDPAATLRDIRKQSLVDMALKGTVPTQSDGGFTTPAEHPDTAKDGAARILREVLGRAVREEWVKWANEQANPKPSWLVPWETLGEPDREVDRRIGMRLYDLGRYGFHAGEHPDTATLRAIRERASDNAALGRIAMERTGLEGEVAVAVRDYLLGDSGPSGGPGGPPLYRCSECGEPRAEHPTKECGAWESSGSTIIGPSWGGGKVPTTPPAVAASDESLFDACARGACEHSRSGASSHMAWGREMAALPENRPPVTGAVATTPTPTHEEDLRTVEEALGLGECTCMAEALAERSCCGVPHAKVAPAIRALARLKDAPHRAAERMRHRADVAVLMLQPPASLLKQCETSAEANAVRGAWCAAINAAVDAIRVLEVTP